MIYERIPPDPALSGLINCFWLVDSENDHSINIQKVIPDGFPEMIFHYGDSYKININGSWEVQDNSLLAGQIKNHFFLENTGKSGMIGIKFMPAAISKLFNINMAELVDSVLPLKSRIEHPITGLTPGLDNISAFIEEFQKTIKQLINVDEEGNTAVELAVSILYERKGLISIKDLCERVDLNKRQLERLFLKYVGLSPKFYSRVIRFGYTFELMKTNDQTWSDLVYQSGFYDQSHFIKNFKEFTGEDPSTYGFKEKNMANFHLDS